MSNTPDSATTSTDEQHGNASGGTDGEQGLYDISPKAFEALFYLIVLAWVLLLLYWTQDWRTSDRLFPRMVGVPLIILLVLQLIRLKFTDQFNKITAVLIDLLSRGSSNDGGISEITDNLESKYKESKQKMGQRSKRERQIYELYMIGWIIALPAMMYYLGFVNAVPVYIFAFMMFFTRNPKLSTAITVGFSIALYILFVVLLSINLWDGTLDLPNILDFLPL